MMAENNGDTGDTVNNYGSGIGKAQHHGSGDIVAGGKYGGGGPQARASALDELLRELRALRTHLDDADRAEVDAVVGELRAVAGQPSDERFKRLLQRIAGIATVIGTVGAPVVSAVTALLAA